MEMQFNFENFNLKSIYKIISPLFEIRNKNIIMQEIKQYIMPRLEIFKLCNRNIYFLVEDEYIETEWKDMVSMHYVNTSYELKNTVIRCHVFSKKEMLLKNYLGFFSLRPIDEIKLMVSFIYPNWNNIRISKDFDTYIMTYNKKIHIFGKCFNINTYPIFCQDSVVTSCAHANIISMGKYLNKKANFPHIRIFDINNSYVFERCKMYPTKGLGFRQMLEIFSNNNWIMTYDSIEAEEYLSYKKNNKNLKYLKQLQENIDANIESALPVLMSVKFEETDKNTIVNHLLQIIGHTSEKVKRYVIYDESGVFVKEQSNERKNYILLSWDEIGDKLLANGAHIFYPQYEKVFMFQETVKEFIIPALKGNNEENITDIIKINSDEFDIRYLMVDNVIVKKFLKDNVNDYENIKNIIERNLPHYIWYCEINVGSLYLVYLADTTYNKETTKNICINNNLIVLDKQIGLLTCYKDNPNYDINC